MIKLLIPIIFALVLIGFFVFALHFSKYKKRGSGCGCGGGGAVYAGFKGKTCEEDKEQICICE